MPTTHATGDLFALDLPALAHGCNTRGSMAGGIARRFADRWPPMEQEYRRRCRAGEFRLGEVMRCVTDEGIVIYNLATQVERGADARLDAIEATVRAALADAAHRGLDRLGVPRLGAGMGGLGWTDVREVLERAGQESAVELVVITRPGAGRG
ncbi:O-acetyl-ADP-ribose deacetylase (regulator of RNase III) [Kineococcus radiotolerans]|uniref:O-acetyl-ADP-ribose deacetylase (Regulator of RNase III) n=1 Tax=Kineococcus radiotolerans TaxID=131568 RepID=A0A7W4XZN2_KINRA|nr:macro domain-containing protein [Kineococcus radiotolerans]MBB2903525.1 O-acetyl-ADP-ribose deacetylase (regulator of RNase III) [Kineococcus radiotolerans]